MESEKDRVEEVIKILKETKRIKEEIKRRGENLTSESDITQAQILFGIGITLAFGIAIITML